MKILYLDYSKCIGCGTCEAVCRFVHHSPRIIMTRTGYGQHVPLYCQHCENPKCMRVCREKAIYKDKSGMVGLMEERCRSCKTKNCLMACPYVAMMCTGRANPVTKCDLCSARGDLGPACVAMCPCDALIFINRDKLKTIESPAAREAFQRVRQYIICPDCVHPSVS
ncbi:4Fe-4S dicluster domain-containing protein [Desulfonatronovibrio hydrogenovorans]|uniref:4Fe-4S dicluster domain-containing protein n=1 Tax=Desulfonatronovibrio hydrogenovorans TaxID=53245 RepID=UPI000556982C|nr:4Fe-4S dicluster domain-containing protein [Desulfonatronovibrio hydrogenovorans]